MDKPKSLTIVWRRIFATIRVLDRNSGVAGFPWAEYWYNTSYQFAIQMAPFEVVYGRPPPTIHSYEVGSTSVAQVETSLCERDDLLRLLKENL